MRGMTTRSIGMNTKNIVLILILAACCILVIQPVQAQGSEDQKTIYQTSFASDPHWVTNTGGASSNYYWVPDLGMYYFSIEPSTGGFVYIPVEFDSGSFTLDYDLLLTRLDEGATFRMGLSGSEMDPTKGSNVISMFTNAKYGRILWLHLVTPGNKLVEVNSQSSAVEMGPDAYKGPTVQYDVNKSYHVTVDYADNTKIMSMKVRDLQSGKDIWGYFIQSNENMRGLNRIYLGSKGDYGSTFVYAQGYIDNVRLSVPSAGPVVTETPRDTLPVTTVSVPVTPTNKPSPKLTVPTPYPTTTPQSPLSGILPAGALAICGALCSISAMRKN
jgi:hypothetical protein